MKSIICCLLFLLINKASSKTYGFDTSLPATVEQFQCLLEDGNAFFIGRIWQNSGKVDLDGIKNIQKAYDAGFTNIHAYFFPCMTCGDVSAGQQMKTALDEMEANGIEIERLWMDIQTDRGNWVEDKQQNRDFIKELIAVAEERIPNVGIYANNQSWDKIVGLDWEEVSNKPLWYPHFGKEPEDLTEDFVPFGGWDMPHMHQFEDNVVVCEVKINRSWEV